MADRLNYERRPGLIAKSRTRDSSYYQSDNFNKQHGIFSAPRMKSCRFMCKFLFRNNISESVPLLKVYYENCYRVGNVI